MVKLIGTNPNQVPTNADLGSMAYQNYDVVAPVFIAGRRNLAINGAMDIWQRGTSFSGLGSLDTYSADRMHSVAYDTSFANASGGQIDRVAIYGTILDGVNFSHALKVSPSSSWKLAYLDQRVEDVTKFSGVSVTVSYYVRASEDVTLTVTPRVNQVFGSGGSSTVATYMSEETHNLTTDWQRISYTIFCPSISGKTVGSGSFADFYIYQATDLSALSSGWVQVTGLQIEYGQIATPFEQRSYGEELALCQRYYQTLTVADTYHYIGGLMAALTTTGLVQTFHLSPPMRAAPSFTSTGFRWKRLTGGLSNMTLSSVSVNDATTTDVDVRWVLSNATTVGNVGFLESNSNSSARLEFKAEL